MMFYLDGLSTTASSNC